MIVKDFYHFKLQQYFEEQPEVDLVQQFCADPTPVIVDFGCGNGGSSLQLRQLYPKAQIFMVDIEDNRSYAQDFPFFKISSNHPEIPKLQDSSVDVVFTRQVLEHVNNLTATLREFHRILKPGGLVIASFPNFLHLRFVLQVYVLRRIYRLGGRMSNAGHRNVIIPHWFKEFVTSYFDVLYEGGNYWVLPLPVKGKNGKHWHWVRLTHKFHPWLSYNYITVLRKKS